MIDFDFLRTWWEKTGKSGHMTVLDFLELDKPVLQPAMQDSSNIRKCIPERRTIVI